MTPLCLLGASSQAPEAGRRLIVVYPPSLAPEAGRRLSGRLAAPLPIYVCTAAQTGGALNLGKLASILTNSKAEAAKMESTGKKPWWKLR